MTFATFDLSKSILRKISFNNFLGLALLWSPIASADPVDAAADFVVGQPDFVSAVFNNGGISGSSLSQVSSLDLDFGGNLYVADTSNNRILIYFFPKGTDKVADIVLGQPDFVSITSNNSGISASSLADPFDLVLDLVAGDLYVVDHTNHRVLIYTLTLLIPTQ